MHRLSSSTEGTFPALVRPGRAGRRGSQRRAWLPWRYLLWRVFGANGWAVAQLGRRTGARPTRPRWCRRRLWLARAAQTVG